MKCFIKSLFNLEFYKTIKSNKLLKSTMHVLTKSIFLGLLISGIKIYSISNELDDSIKKAYEQIPNFKLSQKGLTVENNEDMNLSFAGTRIIIRPKERITKLIVDEAENNSNFDLMVASDGYARVKNGSLELGSFFKDVPFLKDVELTKNNFTAIKEILTLHKKTTLILLTISVTLAVILHSWFRIFIFSIIVFLMAKKINVDTNKKESFNIACYLNNLALMSILIFNIIPLNVPNFVQNVVINGISVAYVLKILLNLKEIKSERQTIK